MTAWPPSSYSPSGMPAAAIASVISAARSGPAVAVAKVSIAVVQVDAVGDQLADHVGRVEQGHHRARLAVVQRPHRVEQVGADAGAGRDRGAGLLVRGVGVPDRGDHPLRGEQLDRLQRAVAARGRG